MKRPPINTYDYIRQVIREGGRASVRKTDADCWSAQWFGGKHGAFGLSFRDPAEAHRFAQCITATNGDARAAIYLYERNTKETP
ncbi:hypothetical protein [Micrococcus sp. TA1]|uniref:hypothetical protein n=1 Tax=Micrococcus sp. TA1 TaxID=681627 RepID=UPI0016119DAA|nr:hypothetical protein [Micrococcus sp. TA1]MBB5748556.1 hypothetical protein [Micrococcus sp. TA1]